MKHLVFSVRDRSADVFAQPFLQPSEAAAMRVFREAVKSASDSMISKYPEDFDLYLLGTFDDTGGMYSTGVPKMICVGKDVI